MEDKVKGYVGTHSLAELNPPGFTPELKLTKLGLKDLWGSIGIAMSSANEPKLVDG